jgi:hypothetical protein
MDTLYFSFSIFFTSPEFFCTFIHHPAGRTMVVSTAEIFRHELLAYF